MVWNNVRVRRALNDRIFFFWGVNHHKLALRVDYESSEICSLCSTYCSDSSFIHTCSLYMFAHLYTVPIIHIHILHSTYLVPLIACDVSDMLTQCLAFIPVFGQENDMLHSTKAFRR